MDFEMYNKNLYRFRIPNKCESLIKHLAADLVHNKQTTQFLHKKSYIASIYWFAIIIVVY